MQILQVQSLTVHEHGAKVLSDLTFTVRAGEQWAVMGQSGSGKTTLLHTLSGRHHYQGTIQVAETADGPMKIVLVEQQHRFRNLSNTSTFYYQQRFNASDAEDAVTVRDDLEAYIRRSSNDKQSDTEANSLLHRFGLNHIASSKLIQLSNGENKRLQIAKAMLLHPEILLLDNPLIGLDAAARDMLAGLLEEISRKGIHIVMVMPIGNMPSFVTNVLYLQKGGAYATFTKAGFEKQDLAALATPSYIHDSDMLRQMVSLSPAHDFTYAVRMKSVNIIYKERKILNDINWQVARGERWALSGPNGAGKSTLLSLINADNPQAYANEIYLFDRRKGSGETIWEIKKKIGYLSPEMHLYFETSSNAFDVIASGLFDTIGLFRLLNEVQEELVMQWMRLLRIDHLRRKLLFQLSNSEQRMVLLARALVKNPPLLILDEPCQGLDDEQILSFTTLIDEICLLSDKTLIYVSHYADEIPSCVDNFIKLENGEVVSRSQ